jgi:hypothetical protein
MYLKIVAGGETTVIDNVSRVHSGRDEAGQSYIDVSIGESPAQRHTLMASAYLMNERGDTIDTFRCAR